MAFLEFRLLIDGIYSHESFSAVQEGLKHMQHNWKLWENAFLLSLQVGDFSFSVKAINKLLDLRRSDVKFGWIKLLADYVTKSLLSGEPDSRVKRMYIQIYGIETEILTIPI